MGKMNSNDSHETADAPDGNPFEVKGLSTARLSKYCDGVKGAAEVGRRPIAPESPDKSNDRG